MLNVGGVNEIVYALNAATNLIGSGADRAPRTEGKRMGEYAERVNATPKQRKIKAAIEAKGYTNVEVWWETLSQAVEMGGMGGGYFAASDQTYIQPLGYSLDEAMEMVDWMDNCEGCAENGGANGRAD